MSECDGKGGREGGREGGRAGGREGVWAGGRVGGREGGRVLCLHVIEGVVPSWESFATQVWKHLYRFRHWSGSAGGSKSCVCNWCEP